MVCSAPVAVPRSSLCSCNDQPSWPQRVLADPGITTLMTAEEVVLSVPKGTLLFVDYEPGTRSGRPESKSRRRAREAAENAASAGMQSTHFVGRLVSAERVVPPGAFPYVLFRLVCLNRGEPGAPQIRAFSTRVGTLNGALLLETPRA